MNKEYKVVQGEYKSEDDTVIEIQTREEVITSNVFHVGQTRAELESINQKIVDLTEKKKELEAKLSEARKAIKLK